MFFFPGHQAFIERGFLASVFLGYSFFKLGLAVTTVSFFS